MRKHIKFMSGPITFVLFLGWLWSGWTYLKGHFPMDLWDSGRVSAQAPGVFPDE